jgi:hypothetical protein
VPVGSLPRRLAAISLGLLSVAFLHGLYDESAALGNRVGVGLLLALSFGLVLALFSRTAGDAAANQKSASPLAIE